MHASTQNLCAADQFFAVTLTCHMTAGISANTRKTMSSLIANDFEWQYANKETTFFRMSINIHSYYLDDSA